MNKYLMRQKIAKYSYIRKSKWYRITRQQLTKCVDCFCATWNFTTHRINHRYNFRPTFGLIHTLLFGCLPNIIFKLNISSSFCICQISVEWWNIIDVPAKAVGSRWHCSMTESPPATNLTVPIRKSVFFFFIKLKDYESGWTFAFHCVLSLSRSLLSPKTHTTTQMNDNKCLSHCDKKLIFGLRRITFKYAATRIISRTHSRYKNSWRLANVLFCLLLLADDN